MDSLSENTRTDNMTLRDYIRVLFKHKATIIIFFLSVTTVVYIGLQFMTPVYEARVKMLVSGKQLGAVIYYKDFGSSSQKEIIATRSEIVKSIPVIKLAVDTLKLYNRPKDYEKEFASPLKLRWTEWKAGRFKKKSKKTDSQGRKDLIYRQSLETLRNKIEIEPIRDTNMFMMGVAIT